jgi:sugar-specific transcriptional regulator TrmB
MDAVQVATTEFLDRQISALQEALEKKDAYIIRLQDENSSRSVTIQTMKSERQNLINTIKEYVIEALRDNDINENVAQSLAEICDFELTKTVTISARVDFEVEIEVPFDTDADEVANTLEFSVDSFDYSIDDFNVDTHSLHAVDNIS